MRTLNANTKQAQRFIRAYEQSRVVTIYEAYKNPSSRKIAIFEQLVGRIINTEECWGFRIIGYNCNYFTMAWTTSEGLRVETYANSYLIKNPEL